MFNVIYAHPQSRKSRFCSRSNIVFQKPDGSENITVGSLIALMVNEGEDWKDVQVPVEGAAPSPSPAAAAATTTPAPTPAAAPPQPVVIDDDM